MISKTYFGHMTNAQSRSFPPVMTEPITMLTPSTESNGDYAKLASPKPFSLTATQLKESTTAIHKLGTHQSARDNDLTSLDNNLKRGGSVLIAALATWGLKQRVLGLPEFLGLSSWFGAMAITPKIVNGMVQAKTGVNLNQLYSSSYGETKNLYTDPNYLPLHVMPDEAIDKIAERYKIPPGPERRKQTEEKLRQISVQGRTWWMLVAGPATPVISGILCDQLQTPLMKLWNQSALSLGLRSAAHKQSEALSKQVFETINRVVGERPEAQLAFWWKDFGRSVLKETGLNKLPIKQMINGTPEQQLQHILTIFEGLSSEQLTSLEHALRTQEQKLEQLSQKAEDILNRFASKLPEQDNKQALDLIDQRLANACNTISHYNVLTQALKTGKLSAEELRLLVEKPILPEVQRLISTGHQAEAKKLAGNTDNFRIISKQMNQRQFEKAFNQMGASIGTHLRSAMKETNLRKLWQRRIPIGLGSTLLAATALYTGLFVGHDFQKKGTP